MATSATEKATDTLARQLSQHIAAGFTGLWIETFDVEDALEVVRAIAERYRWLAMFWDMQQGLLMLTSQDASVPNARGLAEALKAVLEVKSLDYLAEEGGEVRVLVTENLHLLLGNDQPPAVKQAVLNALRTYREHQTFLINISPCSSIPLELEKRFAVLDLALPDLEERRHVAASRYEGEFNAANADAPELVQRGLEAAAGLTRLECDDAFSLSIVQGKPFQPEPIWRYKVQTVRKSGILSIHDGKETFADIGGLKALKEFCLRSLQPKVDCVARAKGVALLGVPGTGKSAVAKALGNETGRPTIMMDLGSMMGSLLGQSEANMRRALRIVDACAPCILFIDEIEKAISGNESSGRTDGGTTSRMFGTFLTWLNDHTSDVFIVATMNSVEHLPPEFLRAERFDGVFFVDFPSVEQQQEIWDIYLRRYRIPQQPLPQPQDPWTGAEIQTCCRLAHLLDISLEQAAQNVVPIYRSYSERISSLRKWASSRCLCAERGGPYRGSDGAGMLATSPNAKPTKRSPRPFPKHLEN